MIRPQFLMYALKISNAGHWKFVMHPKCRIIDKNPSQKLYYEIGSGRIGRLGGIELGNILRVIDITWTKYTGLTF